ncbi:DMT family transporter [Ideonella sp. TBM-1]|uniref:DMT family transporter n=1 Tax=Ideonella livida TaxID=2707176 RepID=A0A7C9PGR3_9BURK|nr:DMT family transporter [Ideonella livida]
MGAVILATASFATLDSLTKLASATLPLALVIWTRYLVMTGATGLTQWPQRGRGLWATHHLGLQLARGACLVACSAFGFLALQHMSVGEFTAVVMLTPLVITAAAALQLGEQVSVLRWGCVAAGFGGALLVIRPTGDDVNWALLYPLGLVAANAAYQVLTSRLARLGENAGTMQFFTGAVGLGAASVVLPFTGLGPAIGQQPWLWGLLAALGFMGWVGHRFLTVAYLHAPASRLTPYLYLQIGFGMLGGWWLFGQVPDALSVLGVALIALGGVAGTWLAAREQAAALAALQAEPSRF